MTKESASFSPGVAFVVAGILFLEFLDATILTTALPALSAEFGVSVTQGGTAVVVYLLGGAATLPAGGWLAQRLGMRRMLLVLLVLFCCASIAAAFSSGLLSLCVARAVQGAAGALMVPVGRLVVVQGLPACELLRAIAYVTWPALVAPVAAPIVGGVITDSLGWRWIFIGNVALSVVLLGIAVVVLPRDSGDPHVPFDWRGFGAVAAVMIAITASAELLSRGRFISAASALAFSLVGFVGVAWWLRTPGRLLGLTVFQHSSFRASNLTGSVFRLVITAAPFLLTLLFQLEFGWSATTAGTMLSALFLGNILIKPATTPIIRRWGFRTVLVFCHGAAAIVLGAFLLVHQDTPTAIIALLLAASGVLRSIAFSAYNTLQFVDVRSSELSDANLIAALLQQLGMSLGIGIAVVLVNFTPSIAIALAVVALLFFIPLGGAWRLSPTRVLKLFILQKGNSS